MHQQTIEKLHTLHLDAMADAFREQLDQPKLMALPFEERFALLVDRQHAAALNAALAQRLRRAGMRQDACLENLDLRTPRGLDRSTMQTLATGQWIRQHLNILLSGKTGIGKSWLACALGNRAARDGFSVLYKRLSARRSLPRKFPWNAGMTKLASRWLHDTSILERLVRRTTALSSVIWWSGREIFHGMPFASC